MIRKVDIPTFGSYKNFVWRDSMRDSGGNVLEFKRLNILYGRNYTGKTTLSRIIRSLEDGRFPDNYESPSFVITTGSESIDQTQIASHKYHVRVYNKDFVDDHLQFLRDGAGNITPFAIVGSENKAVEEMITAIQEVLGNADEETGVQYKHSLKHAELVAKQQELTQARKELKAKMTNKATQLPGGIKHNPLYRDPNYNTPKIEADIQRIRAESIDVLSEDEQKTRMALLNEAALPDIINKLKFTPSMKSLHEQAEKLLSKDITPSQPIQELLDDVLLQSWVKAGVAHHKGRRSTCGFCGHTLPSDLWDKLDSHFSKESKELEEALGEQIKALQAEIDEANDIVCVQQTDFYSTNHDLFHHAKEVLEQAMEKYVVELRNIKQALEDRQNDIFSLQSLPALMDNSTEIVEQIARINTLIDHNNNKTKSLADDQSQAREDLRLSEIAQFIKDIDYAKEELRIATLETAANSAKDEEEHLASEVDRLEGEIDELEGQLRDERKGAEKVNLYLNHFFGHEGLRLEAVEDSGALASKFRILRGNVPAYNLSEGECSLVAFCYFVARLEDVDTKGKDLIVFIDDPVSSLDSNHIFFVYSLIESVFAKPKKRPNGSNEYRYRQLFISTHNLDFLKYLKRLSCPNKNNGGTDFFLVERGGKYSYLAPMPPYLKNYITEFNYLFHQIYKCRDAENVKQNHDHFYNFGNNLRKFLEAYLFYRYPVHGGKFDKLRKFFGDDAASTSLATRLSNELSHLEEIFDRSMRPIEIPEIPKLANFVLEKIYERDPDQYNSLLRSIGEPPRDDSAVS